MFNFKFYFIPHFISLKKAFTLLLLFLTFTTSAQEPTTAIEKLKNKTWFSGAKDCKADKSPAFESFQYNQDTFILRQNKCHHYEAPFIYLLFGENKALLIDTGATVEQEKFSLSLKVKEIMRQRAQQLKLDSADIPLLVAHSHSHSDHIAGDNQFKNVTNAQVIKTNDTNALIAAFSFADWPKKNASITLGKRTISVIPTPGHQAQAITFYDHQTSLLLTGDSIYPGRLYVKNWQDYKNSIQRIATFAETHVIAGMLGAHIEMSRTANIDYPVGSTYQPNEASLVLTVDDLNKLNHNLIEIGDKPTRTNLANMIIYPK